jgi:hypothetical protein
VNAAEQVAQFAVNYLDRSGHRKVFYIFPEPIRIEGGHRKQEFLVRTSSDIPPPGTDRVFQFDLKEIAGEWRVVMIGQLDGYAEFAKCGLPERVIIAVARRFRLPIRSSSLKIPTSQGESRTEKVTRAWKRLAELAAETDDWRVEYSDEEDVFRLMPVPRKPDN